MNKTPAGLEHVREVRQLWPIADDDKDHEKVPVSEYKGEAVYLVLGTRIRMGMSQNEVFAPRNVEIRFAP